MRLNMCSDSIHILELLLAERAREVLCGVYGGVVDELVLRGEGVLALLAAVLLVFAERPPPGAYRLAVCLTQVPVNMYKIK